MDKKFLEKYLKEYMEKGYSYEQLEKTLISQNYSKKDIKDSYELLTIKTKIQSIEKNPVILTITISSIIIILFLISFLIYSNNNNKQTNNDIENLINNQNKNETTNTINKTKTNISIDKDNISDNKTEKNKIINNNNKTNQINDSLNLSDFTEIENINISYTYLENNSCTKDSDCEDNKIETYDYCQLPTTNSTNESGICKHNTIKSCINNDGFCPTTCRNTNDNDCPKLGMRGNFYECYDITDCDDGQDFTEDSCFKNAFETIGICFNEDIKVCRNDDGFCPAGCSSGIDNDCIYYQ
jgi:hypothetical protein